MNKNESTNSRKNEKKKEEEMNDSAKVLPNCLDCEQFKQRVKEIEQSVSGRDILIEMLQNQLKKFENLYKNSLDDTEKLRFKYCVTIQELSNFKEICKKLEEENIKLYSIRNKNSVVNKNHSTDWRYKYSKTIAKIQLMENDSKTIPMIEIPDNEVKQIQSKYTSTTNASTIEVQEPSFVKKTVPVQTTPSTNKQYLSHFYKNVGEKSPEEIPLSQHKSELFLGFFNQESNSEPEIPKEIDLENDLIDECQTENIFHQSEIQKLKSQNENLEFKIEYFTAAEIAKDNYIQELENKNSKLLDENTELEQKMEVMQENLKALKSKNDKDDSELKVFYQQLGDQDKINKNNLELNDQIAQVEEIKIKLQNEIINLNHLIEISLNEKTECNNKLEILRNQMKTQEAHQFNKEENAAVIQDLQQQIIILQQHLDQIEPENVKLKNEMTKLKQENESLMKLNETYKDKVFLLDSGSSIEDDNLSDQNKALKDQISSLEEEKNHLIKEHSKIVKELNDRIVSAEKHIINHKKMLKEFDNNKIFVPDGGNPFENISPQDKMFNQIQDLKEQNVNLKQKLAALESESAKANLDLNAVNEDLRVKLAALQDATENGTCKLNEQIKNCKLKLSKLKDEIKNEKLELKKNNDENEHLKLKVAELQEKTENKKLQLNKFIDENENLKGKVVELQDGCETEKLEVIRVNVDNQNLKAKVAKLQDRIENEQFESNVVNDENKNLKLKVTELQDAIEIEKLELNRVNDDNKNLKLKVAELQDGMKNEKFDVNKVIEENEDYKLKVVELRDGIENTKFELNKVNEHNENLKLRLSELQDGIENENFELNKVNDENKMFKLKIAELEDGLENEKIELNKVNTQNENLKLKVAELQDGIENEKLEVNKVVDEIENLKHKLAELEDEVENKKLKLKKVNAENEHLKQNVADLRDQGETRTSKLNKANEENESLTLKVAALQDASRTSQLHKANEENGKLKLLEDEISKQKGMIETFKKQINDLNLKYDSVKNENAKLQKANATLNSTITELTDKIKTISVKTDLVKETPVEEVKFCFCESSGPKCKNLCVQKYYNAELTKKQKIIYDLKDSLEALSKTLEECESELKSLKTQNEKLREENIDYKMQLDNCLSSKNDPRKREELEKLRNENISLKDDIKNLKGLGKTGDDVQDKVNDVSALSNQWDLKRSVENEHKLLDDCNEIVDKIKQLKVHIMNLNILHEENEGDANLSKLYQNEFQNGQSKVKVEPNLNEPKSLESSSKLKELETSNQNLILQNQILVNAINSLVTNLENTLKSLQCNTFNQLKLKKSAEIMTTELLKSFHNFYNGVVDKNTKKCDCINTISSIYKISNKSKKGHETPTKSSSSERSFGYIESVSQSSSISGKASATSVNKLLKEMKQHKRLGEILDGGTSSQKHSKRKEKIPLQHKHVNIIVGLNFCWIVAEPTMKKLRNKRENSTSFVASLDKKRKRKIN